MNPALVAEVCLPYLLKAQNPDGGWGFRSGMQSRVEPTVWALSALAADPAVALDSNIASRGLRYLSDAQLPDGSWPCWPEIATGSWVTALACLALSPHSDALQTVKRGLHWITSEVPGEARLLRRIVTKFKKNRLASQNDAYFGWSWTPGTASWVEPTSYAVILLRYVAPSLLSPAASRRLRIAESMLFDRMCPGGGWNCGNPVVYGVAGEPQVSPTVWALLALRACRDRIEVQQSLDWLRQASPAVRSPGSLALGLLSLRAYDQPRAPLLETLTAIYNGGDILWNTPEVAWAALALGACPPWLASSVPGVAV